MAAEVIATREGRAYLLGEAADSTALVEGARLTFLDRKKRVATGTVIRSYADGLAVAAVTSGSLNRRKLDRVKILAEPPLRTRPAVLRVGLPGRRPSAWFDCTDPSLGIAGSLDTLLNGTVRVVGAGPDWPDTLLVRRFDEVADQEIALERGDLDVGVFWPGELTPAARRNLNWDGTLAPLGRGTVFWYGVSGLDTSVVIAGKPSIFSELNQQMFRGDLKLLTDADPRAASGEAFTVDAAIPGRASIEAFLNRGISAMRTPRWRVAYRDVPLDSVSEDVQVFAMRCAVVIRPEWRSVISAADATRLANLNQCTKDQP